MEHSFGAFFSEASLSTITNCIPFNRFFVVQIVECRRVLKWTYAYGYYLPENEHTKRQFFEYSQGEAEAGLERLHQCAEKDLLTFLGGTPTSSFNDFRTKLAGLTRCLFWNQGNSSFIIMFHQLLS